MGFLLADSTDTHTGATVEDDFDVTVARIEVESPCVVAVALVERRQPVVAVQTHIAERTIAAIACSRKENVSVSQRIVT